MAGLDKEETNSIVAAVKDVMLRFGSTRWLALATSLAYLAYLAHTDAGNAIAYGGAGTALTILCLASFHLRPHGGADDPTAVK